ncbi:MAG TPA: hypothetical protein VHE35_07050 [Kofleriaceae bacterium]|nr:hypothetical protein [Kofleriaceae bacterium]
MGKVEDMRRLREAQHAGGSAKAAAADAPAAGGEDVGVCASCGKSKPLQRGVIASHQKGLGTMCPGSRKPPA